MKTYRCVTYMQRGVGVERDVYPVYHEEHEPVEMPNGASMLEFRTDSEGPAWRANVCRRCRAIYAEKGE